MVLAEQRRDDSLELEARPEKSQRHHALGENDCLRPGILSQERRIAAREERVQRDGMRSQGIHPAQAKVPRDDASADYPQGERGVTRV